MSSIIALPDWAAADPSNPNRVIVDSGQAYPAWLGELGVDEKALDQYWLEVAHQCIKMDVMAAMGGRGLTIKMTRAATFAQAVHKPGKGAAAASRGKEAREHYRRVRGFLPA